MPDLICRRCLAGRSDLCPDMVFYATPPVDGAFAEYVVTHQAFAHPVPDSISDDAAALLEPLSVAIWACQKGRVTAGTRVLVTGAVYEWTDLRRPADGDAERLNTDFYAFFAVPGVLDADTLPFTDADGRPLRRAAYLAAVRAQAAAHPQGTEWVTTDGWRRASSTVRRRVPSSRARPAAVRSCTSRW